MRSLGSGLMLVALSACTLDTGDLVPPLDRPGDVSTAAAFDAGPLELGADPDMPFVDQGTIFPPTTDPVLLASRDALWRFNPGERSITLIGPFLEDGVRLQRVVSDIAIDLEGRLVGGTEGATTPGLIYRIDPGSGACALAFPVDVEPVGLTFTSQGELVVAGRGAALYDPNSGELLRRFESPSDYQTSGDIVGLPNGRLYWTVLPGGAMPTGDGLVELDPRTGDMRFVGALQWEQVFGLAWVEGELLGFDRAGRVLNIRQEDAKIMRATGTAQSWSGATTNPVLWP